MRRLVIFDLDGTLYRGEEPVPGAAETVRGLRDRGALVRFFTNNSTRTPEAAAAKLTRLGIEADPSEVVTSAIGAAQYCRDEGLRRVYAIGEEGLFEVLRRAGLELTEDLAPDAVVLGYCRGFTYDRLNEAMQRVLRGARLIATNADPSYPEAEGRLIPGTGAWVAALERCSGASAFVAGKPNPHLVRLLLEETGFEPSEAIVVGDRVDTDLECGRRAGCATALVLTGVTNEPPPGQRTLRSLTELLDG